MMEIFNYEFMIRAFMAGGMVGVIAPLIGSFLVAKKYSLMADSLAHVALAGVALGLLIGVSPVYTAVLIAILAAVLIEKLRTNYQISGEIALAMFLSGGLAIAVVLIGLGRGLNVDIFAYLFGSITTVRPDDLWIIAGLGLTTLLTAFMSYRALMYVSFDEEAALVSGVPVSVVNTLLMVLTALVVSVSMRIVGVLLIGALMVIPVVTAMRLRRSFTQTIIWSVFFSLASVMIGLYSSYYLGLASGGAIVITALLIFSVVVIMVVCKKA